MTAVEQFIEQLEEQGDSWENVSIGRIQISIKVEDYLELQRQAKEMEKEEKIEFAKHFLYKCKDLSIVMAHNQAEQELIKYELNKSE